MADKFEPMRFMRMQAIETAAGVFTEKSFDTQLSMHSLYIWLIHLIEVELDFSAIDDPTASAQESLSYQITRSSQTAIVNIDDPDIIFRNKISIMRTAAIGTDAGPGYKRTEGVRQFYYKPPIAYAGAAIFVSLKSTSSATKEIRMRIGYTLKKVSEREFFSIANAILT